MTQLGLFVREPAPRPYERIPIYKVTLVRDGSMKAERPQLRDSASVYQLLKSYLAGEDREHFVCLLIDRKNRLVGINTVSIGSLTAAVVHPREVFKPAILANASAVVLCHNHPSGDPKPSEEDRLLTRKLVLAGEALSIKVLDHIVIGENAYYSFSNEGLL